MAVEVEILSRHQRLRLAPGSSEEPTVVPAEVLLIELSGQSVPTRVRLDGSQVNLVQPNPGVNRSHFVLDAFRSVGFHRLQTGIDDYYFATDDAKLRLSGILKLLDYLRAGGLSWGAQLVFSDGQAIRDARVDYAWLVEHCEEILALATAIADRPCKQRRQAPVRTGVGGGSLLFSETLQLLRREPSLYLEECSHPAPVAVSGRGYAPRMAVRARPLKDFDSVPNRRTKVLVDFALSLARAVLESAEIPGHSKRELQGMARGLARVLERYPFTALHAEAKSLPEQRVGAEIVDRRYRRTFELYQAVRSSLGWSPGASLAPTFAFVAYADEIYQAFVTTVLARAFGADPTQAVLRPGQRRPAFSSDQFDIYYDTTPPRPQFQSWRDDSSRPTGAKPDVILLDKVHSTGLIGDAKYRVGGSGRLPASALGEAQVYMQTFDQDAIVLFYPGPDAGMEEVTGRGRTILSVSVSPYEGLSTYLREEVRPRLEALFGPLEA